MGFIAVYFVTGKYFGRKRSLVFPVGADILSCFAVCVLQGKVSDADGRNGYLAAVDLAAAAAKAGGDGPLYVE